MSGSLINNRIESRFYQGGLYPPLQGLLTNKFSYQYTTIYNRAVTHR